MIYDKKRRNLKKIFKRRKNINFKQKKEET